MQFDWFTFAAQVVNFLLLVWLLHRLLYRRLVRAMEQREERIAARFRAAEEREEAAARAEESFRQREGELESRRDELLARAREDAERRRRELVQEARAEAEAHERSWRQELDRERATFLAELRRRIAKAALAVSRRALADLADARLEEQALARFRRRLESLEGEERRRLAAALAGGERLVLASAFPVAAAERERLAEALRGIAGHPLPPLAVTVDPGRGFGLELEAAGWKVGWSLDGYLEGLAERVGELLEAGGEEAGPASPARAGSGEAER